MQSINNIIFNWHFYYLGLVGLISSSLIIAFSGSEAARRIVSAISSALKTDSFDEPRVVCDSVRKKSVATLPGQIATTRMLYCLTSSINALESPITACLDAQ